jgi:hypothetical protein
MGSRTAQNLLIPLFCLLSGSLCWGADPPWVHDETGIVFPARLGGMVCRGMDRYGQQELGISVRYEGAHLLKTDVYLYNMGLKAIPNGPDSDVVRNHFEGVTQDLFAAQRQGLYSSVVEIGSGTTLIGSPREGLRALYKCFEYHQNPSPGIVSTERRRSYLVLTGYRNHFLKIRLTFLTTTEQYGEAILKRFLADLGRVLKGRTPTRKRQTEPPPGTSPVSVEPASSGQWSVFEACACSPGFVSGDGFKSGTRDLPKPKAAYRRTQGHGDTERRVLG